MAPTYPLSHIVQPSAEHTHTIILLHGRNSNGADFADELLKGRTSDGQSFLQHSTFQGIKWIFPNAPTTYSEQFQQDLSEWFDLASTSNPQAHPERQIDGLDSASAHMCTIIDQELQFIPADRIILGGISQGFATAAYTLLCGRSSVVGFIGISGWIPDCSRISELNRRESGKAQKSLPILIAHAQDDEVIEIQNGRDAAETLRKEGYTALTINEYTEGGHEINEPLGFDDLKNFICKNISKTMK